MKNLNRNAALAYIILGYPVASVLVGLALDTQNVLAMIERMNFVIAGGILLGGLIQGVLISIGWACFVGAPLLWLAKNYHLTTAKILGLSIGLSIVVTGILGAAVWHWTDGQLLGATNVLLGASILAAAVGLLGGLGLLNTPKQSAAPSEHPMS